jgi:UDP-glucose 4-epimerase
MAKILVTGGAGFIGSHVVDLYIENGHSVVIIDNLSTGHERNINPKAAFYKVDIRDPQLNLIFEKEKPDYINHHAAQMDVRRSIVDPKLDADINILGSINLLESARMFGVKRFIYISTGGAVYGEPEYLPCDESHPIKPICQYGASKHTVEHYLYMYQVNYGVNYTVLRYPNVYGPRQDPLGEAGVVAIFTGQMLDGKQVLINGDGEQSRDFTYVKDCARANLVATTMEHSSDIFNLGFGEPTSVNQIFTKLAGITGYRLSAKYGPAKLGETRHIYLDASKAQEILGWLPNTSLDDGLRQTVDYFRASGKQL